MGFTYRVISQRPPCSFILKILKWGRIRWSHSPKSMTLSPILNVLYILLVIVSELWEFLDRNFMHSLRKERGISISIIPKHCNHNSGFHKRLPCWPHRAVIFQHFQHLAERGFLFDMFCWKIERYLSICKSIFVDSKWHLPGRMMAISTCHYRSYKLGHIAPAYPSCSKRFG